MLRRLSPILAAGLLAALAVAAQAADRITPSRAIEAAAAAAPAPVNGTFELRVQATGRDDSHVYLNSEADYRDQRNLTIDLSPAVAQAIEAKHHQTPEAYFQGHRLLVSGLAQRVTIYFFADGEQTDKYYYQTHVDVADPAQLKLLD